MTKVIYVPVKFEGKELKAPFLLFVGWTPEQRREYAEDLRKVLKEAETVGFQEGLCKTVTGMLSGSKVSVQTAYTLVATLEDVMSFETLARLHGVYGKGPELRKLWLKMQIGMVDVPNLEFWQ